MPNPSEVKLNELDDGSWFLCEENSGRTFRLRRLFTIERVGDAVSADGYGRVPSHALIMQDHYRRYTLYCNDGSDGGIFDALMISRDYRNTDVVYATLWGRMIFCRAPLTWDDIVDFGKLSADGEISFLKREWLQ